MLDTLTAKNELLDRCKETLWHHLAFVIWCCSYLNIKLLCLSQHSQLRLIFIADLKMTRMAFSVANAQTIAAL